jgi:hypothetical protein
VHPDVNAANNVLAAGLAVTACREATTPAGAVVTSMQEPAGNREGYCSNPLNRLESGGFIRSEDVGPVDARTRGEARREGEARARREAVVLMLGPAWKDGTCVALDHCRRIAWPGAGSRS